GSSCMTENRDVTQQVFCGVEHYSPLRRYYRGPILILVIATDAAPKAIGPYSQAIVNDNLVFTAGQVALDPKSGELVGRSTAEQTEQVFANLKAVLAAAGTSLQNVVKTTVYLADMADFPQLNEVYAKHFGAHKP